MPYKGKQKIVFPQHETQNVMLLFGDNMRGKTSFLNAIRWGFYGVAVGRHLRSINRANLINMDAAAEGDWSMSIVLTFSYNGKNYELRRQIQKKRHVSQPKNDADFEENIGLRVDGIVLPGDVITNEINQVIPEEISRFFLFDGELLQEYENLLIDESEQGEKIKEHIEQALGVPALVHGRDEFNALLKEARRIQTRDAKKNKELQGFAEQQRQFEFKLISLEKDLADLQTQHLDIQQKVDEIDDELKNTEAVQRKKGELEGLNSNRISIEKQLIDLANDERELLKTAWKDILHNSVEPVLNRLMGKRETLQNVVTNSAVRESKIKELSKTIENPTCPTCGQKIPNSEIQPIKDRINVLKAKAELSIVEIEDISQLNGKIDKLSKIRSSDEIRRIFKVVDEQRNLQGKLSTVETKLDELEEEIKEYDTDQIMRQREKRDRLAVQLSKLERDIDGRDADIEKNNKSQDHIATLISKSAGAKGQLSSTRVKLYQDLEAIFSQGIDYLRDSLREQVAGYATKAFAELTTEKTYSGLQINQNYGLSIIDHKGRLVEERSAGAEQIVALSLIDGLNRTARKSGPIVMDTPLGRLDPKHRSNVLKYLPKMADQVVLLVHEGEIDPDRDIPNFAGRIGARYHIERITATESKIVKSN